MNPFFLGGMAGIILAVLNFYASVYVTSKTISTLGISSVALTVLSFFARLLLLGVIFYGLSSVKEIHFKTALISFVTAFTVCLILKAYRLYQKTRPTVTKQTES
jgi:hypothetical protein